MATILVRFATYLDLMLLFGTTAFAVTGSVGREPGKRWIAAAIVLALLLTALSIANLAASMAGVPIGQLDRATIAMVLGLPTIALPMAIRVVALVTALACLALPDTTRRWGLCLAAAIALASLSGIGHGLIDTAMAGWLHLGADIIHLWAAGMWLGAIMMLFVRVQAARREPASARAEEAWRAAANFARTGTLLVGAIVLTGAVNGIAIIGWSGLPALPTTPYGRLLIAKLLLFAAMLALAAANRFRHVPRLRAALDRRGPADALVRLKRSLIAEAACGIAVLALVAWLGTLDPAGAS